jgi:uncharacterized membrane protein YsdA (DUF1294 family)
LQAQAGRRMIAAVLFMGALLAAGIAGVLPLPVVAWYALASGITFLFYAADKSAAMRRQPRTRERTLHCCAVAGGWPGAALAQGLLRHKTRKQPFRTVFMITALLNCALLALALYLGSGSY